MNRKDYALLPPSITPTLRVDEALFFKDQDVTESFAALSSISDTDQYVHISKDLKANRIYCSPPQVGFAGDSDEVVSVSWLQDWYQNIFNTQIQGLDDASTQLLLSKIAEVKNAGNTNSAAITDLESTKVETSDFLQYKTTLDSSLASKADKSTVYVKTAVDSLLANKANLSDTFTRNLLYIKSEIDALLSQKVSATEYQTFAAQTNTNLNLKQNIADSYNRTQTDLLINQKTSNTDFVAYKDLVTTSLNTKVNSSDYNSFVTSTNTALNNKQSTFTNAAILAMVDQNVSKTSSPTFVNPVIATPAAANHATPKSFVDTAVTNAITTSANSLQTYITSNDAAVADRITTATFQNYDTIVVNNFTNLQGQISQRLKTSDFDTYRVNTASLLNTKQNTIPYNFDQGVSTADSPSFTQVSVSAAPSSNTSLTNKAYVDARNASLLAGTGLTRNVDTFSVNAEQPGITLVGALSGLNVQGGASFAQPLTLPIGDCLRFTRANGATGQMLIGGDATSNEIFNFKHLGGNGEFLFTTAANGKVTFNTPTVTISNTNDTTSPSTGGAKILGGLGVAKSLQVGGELFVSNGAGSRLKLQSTNNFFAIGGASGDGSGDFHVYDFTGSNRLIGWYRADNTWRIGNVAGTSTVQIAGTADSTSISTGSLQTLGGVGIAKSLQVGANLTVNGNGILSNLGVSGTSNFTGLVTASSLNITSSGNQPFNISLSTTALAGGVSAFSNYFKPAMGANETILVGFGQSNTPRNMGYLGYTYIANNSNNNCMSIGLQSVDRVLNVYGDGRVQVTTTSDSSAYNNGSFTVGGGAGIGKNLYIGGSLNAASDATFMGTLTASNVKSAQVAATFSQSGVTWTNVTLSVCNYSKVGRNVTASYEFVWENQSGNANGQFTFSLPFQPKNTTLLRSVMVGDGNSYASNSGGMTEYMCKFTALGNNAVLYSNLAANLPSGSGSGGISFSIWYYANS